MLESAAEDPEIGVEADLAAVSPDRIGWFRYCFDDQRWEWSDQVQRMHGYEPGTVIPSTALVLSHKHPDDREQVAATIDTITQTRGQLSSRHRIVDTTGVVHWVVVIGDELIDADGTTIGTHGFYIDVTPAARVQEEMVTARLGEIADKRAPIEQAKGMLMLVYDIDDTAAFDLLKWLSQRNNVKLRLLAKQITRALREVAHRSFLDNHVFDHALLTAHHRPADD